MEKKNTRWKSSRRFERSKGSVNSLSNGRDFRRKKLPGNPRNTWTTPRKLSKTSIKEIQRRLVESPILPFPLPLRPHLPPPLGLHRSHPHPLYPSTLLIPDSTAGTTRRSTKNTYVSWSVTGNAGRAHAQKHTLRTKVPHNHTSSDHIPVATRPTRFGERTTVT